MQTTETTVKKTVDETTFSWNNDRSVRQSTKENWLTKSFGNKQFVFKFWKLILPTIVWGFITSLVPLLFNVFAANTFAAGQGLAGNEYMAINYTYGVFSTFNTLVTVFLFAVFPAVGNFIGRGHFVMMRQTIRFAFYIGFSIALILMIFEQAFAADMMDLFVWSNAPSGNQTTLSVNLLRFMSFISFFYLWAWIYVPTLSSIQNTRVIFYSAFLAFSFFIIATPSYLSVIKTQVEAIPGINSTNPSTQATDALNALSDKSFIGLGAIYLTYFIIQPVFLYIYCRFPRQFKHAGLVVESWFNKKITKEIINERDQQHNYERELLFFDNFDISLKLVARIFRVSWCIITDQLLFSIITIIQTVFIINYGGYFPTGDGFDLNGSISQAQAAGAALYRTITSNEFMLQIFLFGIFNSFTIAPQYFVATKLGKGNKKDALKNEYICLNWSIVIGVVLMILMFICGRYINEPIYPSSDGIYVNGQNMYYLYINNTSNSYVSFNALYLLCQNIMYIFAGFMVINTVCSMVFFVMIEGGSKYIVFGDSIVQILFTIIQIILFFTHYNNMYVYFTITQLMLVVKTIVSYLIVGFKKALDSIQFDQLDVDLQNKHQLKLQVNKH